MDSRGNEGSGNGDDHEASDPRDRATDDGGSSEESRGIDGSASPVRRISGGLRGRIRDFFRADDDDDDDESMLIDRSEVENGIMRWLRALDLHVMGACRADERLKPLLKLNISNGVAEGSLLAQLSQHFEASEVGMLARCLCVPLVSIRVGKVYKQGNLLCPSSTRGHLNLTLLPTSSMRLSFTGDDGCTERLVVLNNNFDISEVVIEEITADSSGRSFLLKLPGSKVLFFWSSEKSKLHGAELLAQMKDLLRRKPTLSHLTGISESRLESFATHLRMYLLGSSNAPEAYPLAPSVESPAIFHVAGKDVSSPSQVLEASRCHFRASHASTGLPSHQDCLAPRPTTFKDGATRSLPSIRGIREKLRKRGDISNPSSFINSQLTTFVPSSSQTIGNCEDDSMRPSDGCDLLPLSSHAEISRLSSSPPPSISLLPDLPLPKISTSKSMFSPYYCLCPPCPSSLQYSLTPSHLPLPVTYDESIPLPPLSSLLSSGPPGPPVISNSGVPVPTLNLPSLLPEPIVRLPLPVTSLVKLPTSQHFPTFTPYMSDPIVHTPVIDVCSLGQGYLVSTGPAISSAVPPLLPSFVNHPLISNTESAVEKNARETLRMLMASTPEPTCQKPMNILPPFLNRIDASFSTAPGSHGGTLGLLRGSLEVEAVVTSLSSMGLTSSRDKFVCDSIEGGKTKMGNDTEDQTPSSPNPNSEGFDFAEDGLSGRLGRTPGQLDDSDYM